MGSGFSTSAAPAISEYDGGSKIFLWASASNSLWYNLFDLKTYAFGGWSNSLAGGKTLSSGPGAF